MKVIQFLKKYMTILTGLLIISVFIGTLGVCRLYQNKEWSENQRYTEDMLRVQNMESLESSLEISKYFIGAILDKDIDRALRGCAIDEKCLNHNYKILMEQKAEHEIDIDIAPSAEDNVYLPINSAIFIEEYNEQISILLEAIGTKKLELKEVHHTKKSKQSLDNYKKEQGLKKGWGIDNLEEILVRLEEEDRTNYMVALTVAEYEYGWKIFEIGSKEMGLTYENPLKKVEKQEYLELIDQEKCEKKDQSSKENKSESIKSEDILLPLNYFKISQRGEKSINRVLEEFTAYIQRKDMIGAMNYIRLDEDKEFFTAQKDVAGQMRDFCKGMMEIRDTNRNPRLWDAEELTYLGLNGVYEIDKTIPENKLIIYYYDDNYYAVGCKFIEMDDDWMIQEFTAFAGMDDNQFVRKITKEELKQLQDFQDSDEKTFHFGK